MQTSEQTAEKLHQQASANYLQGKFAEALAVWRQILQADPEDERAKEGLRLCELLTEDGAIEAEPVEAEPLEAVPEAAAEEPIEFEVPDLELDLPSLDAVDPAQTVESEMLDAPDPDRQADGIELDEEPETLEIAGEVPPAPAEIVEGIAEVGAIPDAGVEIRAPESPPAAAAGSELQRRVQDLMTEAAAAYASGDNDTARSVLSRVFILDETHAQALHLQEAIENGVPPVTEHADVADLDAPEHDAAPGEFDLMSDDPDAEPIAPVEGPVEAVAAVQAVAPLGGSNEIDLETGGPELAVAAASGASADDALHLDAIETAPEGSIADEILDELPDFDDEAEMAAAGKRVRLPQPNASNSKTKMIFGGVVVAIVAVVAVGFWMRLQGTKIRDEPMPLPAIQAAAEAGGNAGAAPPETQAAQADESSASVVDAGSGRGAPVDVHALMAEGRQAMDQGEYAAALVAFHAVMEADPTHLEASERMEAATENYKLQQEVEKQWLAATALFRDGEHRSAMKMFYRLEPDSDQDVARLERYKTNGWYNMGVLALRSGHCELARSHMTEAEQISPADADVATALALADSCEAGSRRTGYQRALQVIHLRGLDD
jgi:tetratricopeptide (TPR) repeat protein